MRRKYRTLTDDEVLKNYELRRLFHEPREMHVSKSSAEDFHLEELFELAYEMESIKTKKWPFFLQDIYLKLILEVTYEWVKLIMP